MALLVEIQRYLDVTLFHLTGRVTLGEGCVILRNRVREALWNGHRKLAFDYGKITYQDSSGFGELVAAHTMARNSGGKLVLFGLQEKTRDAFIITKLLTVFDIFDTDEAALAHFDAERERALKVASKRYQHVSVLTLEGCVTREFDLSKVSAAANAALDSGATGIVVLCPQVLDIDSDGAEELIASRSKVQAKGGDLVLAGIESRLMPAVSSTPLLGEISAFDSVDAALGEFGLGVDRSTWRIEALRAV
jgi:anti-sigma B factor antagonist